MFYSLAKKHNKNISLWSIHVVGNAMRTYLRARFPLACHSVIPQFASSFPTMDNRFSASDFKRAALQAVTAASAAVRKIRVDDEVFRKLRLRMISNEVTREHLVEALTVIMRQMAERDTSRTVRLAQVVDLIRSEDDGAEAANAVDAEAADAVDAEADNDEAEWVGDRNLAAPPMWQVRHVLNRFRGEDGQVYYLVDWEPTIEPRENIPRNLIAAFDRERRALVRAAYIEDEAEEA
jgi:hypothetical protein